MMSILLNASRLSPRVKVTLKRAESDTHEEYKPTHKCRLRRWLTGNTKIRGLVGINEQDLRGLLDINDQNFTGNTKLRGLVDISEQDLRGLLDIHDQKLRW